MSFDPTTNPINNSFDQCIIRTSKRSGTGLVQEDASHSRWSLIHYFGKIFRWLRHPCTHMGTVWGRMHNEGLRLAAMGADRGERLEKLSNLKGNLEKFKVQVIDKHNRRRWKLFTKLHLAGVRAAEKNGKYDTIERDAARVLGEWTQLGHPSVEVRQCSPAELFNRFSSLKASIRHADAIFQNGSSAYGSAYQVFCNNRTVIVRNHLLATCRAKVEAMIAGNPPRVAGGQNAELVRLLGGAVQQITQIYGVASQNELPAEVDLDLRTLQNTIRAHGFIEAMREHERNAPAPVSEREAYYNRHPVDEAAIQDMIDNPDHYSLSAETHRILNELLNPRVQTHAATCFTIPNSPDHDVQNAIVNGRHRAAQRIAGLEASGELHTVQTHLEGAFADLKAGRPINESNLPQELKAQYFEFLSEEADGDASHAEKYVKSLTHVPAARDDADRQRIGAELAASKREYIRQLEDLCFIEALAQKSRSNVRNGLSLIGRAHVLGVCPGRAQCQINYTIPDKDFERLTHLETYQYFCKAFGTDYVARKIRDGEAPETANNIPVTTVGYVGQPSFRVLEMEPVPQAVMEFLGSWKDFMGIAD